MTLDERLEAARRAYRDRSWDPPADDVPMPPPAIAPRTHAPRLVAVAAAACLLIGAGWLVATRDRSDDLRVTATSMPARPPGTADPADPFGPGGPRWARTAKMPDRTIGAAVASSDRLYLGYRTFDPTTFTSGVMSAGGVAVLDLATGALVADHALPGAVSRGGLAIAGGKVWFTITNEKTPDETALYALAEADGATPARIDAVDAGTTVAAGGDRVWVRRWTETQERDVADGRVVARTPAPSAGTVASDGTTTWTTTSFDRTLTRVTSPDSSGPSTPITLSAGGEMGEVHVAGGIVAVAQGGSVTLADAGRGQAVGTLPFSPDSVRPLRSTDLVGHVLWVVTFSGRIIALDLVTGARHVMDPSDNWAESPSTVTALSDRAAVVCYGDDEARSFCRRFSTDGSTPTDPSARGIAFHPVTFDAGQLQTFRARATASDDLIDRSVPKTIGDVAATTSVVASGHIIGGTGPVTVPFVLAPDQGALPNGDVVAEQLVLLVRVDRVERRPGAGELTVAAGDLIAVPWTIAIGMRDQSASRSTAAQAAVDGVPLGARITIPFDVGTTDGSVSGIEGLRLGGRPFLAMPDGSHVTPLEPTLDAIVEARTLDDITTELVAAVKARR